MRPSLVVATLFALVCPAAVLAQPGPGHPHGMVGGAFAASRPMPHPGFDHFHPGRHFHRPFFRPFGVVSPFFGFGPFYSPGFYGYAGGYDSYWPYYIAEDQQPAPLALSENTFTVPAAPVRWGSSTLELAPAAADPRAAVITVQLPANAVLYVQGEKQAGATGPTREVVTPPLKRGRSYDYDVKAVWDQDGRAITRVQRVTVRMGDRQSLTFLPAPSE